MPAPGMHSGVPTDDAMNLAMSEHVVPLFEKVVAFIANEVDPITEEFYRLGEGRADRWSYGPGQLELLDSVKAKAKANGLWNFFLPDAETGQGLGDLGPWLWQALGLVRIYTKTPGKPVLHDRPFTLRRGEQTVGGVARLVHREMAKSLKYARVWGRSVVAEGQHVGRDHVLADRDLGELPT